MTLVPETALVSSQKLSFCFPLLTNPEFWEISAGKKELIVDGLLSDIGIVVVLPLRSSNLATGLPVLLCTGIPPVALWLVEWRIPWRVSVMNRTLDVDCQKRFPVHMLRSRLNTDRGLGTTAIWLGTRENVPLWFDSISWKSPESITLQLLYLWSEPLYRVMTFSQFLRRKNSSTRNSWALFNSPISCILLIWVSRSAFSFMTNYSCSRTCSLRDSTYPRCASSNANRWA